MTKKEKINAKVLYSAILALQNETECAAFFDDLCTYHRVRADPACTFPRQLKGQLHVFPVCHVFLRKKYALKIISGHVEHDNKKTPDRKQSRAAIRLQRTLNLLPFRL